MTDTSALLDERIRDDVRDVLTARWQTPREIHAKASQWTLLRVRHALRDMAERGEVQTRQGGTADRPIREYRAK